MYLWAHGNIAGKRSPPSSYDIHREPSRLAVAQAWSVAQNRPHRTAADLVMAASHQRSVRWKTRGADPHVANAPGRALCMLAKEEVNAKAAREVLDRETECRGPVGSSPPAGP